VSVLGPELKRVYIILSDRTGHGALPRGVLRRILDHVNHLGDLYLISEDLLRDWGQMLQLLDEAAGFLHSCGFSRLNLRPVHPVRAGKTRELADIYRVVGQMGGSFHKEALGHQVASRWVVLPVLRAQSDEEVRKARAVARFLRSRLILPSLSVSPMPRLQGAQGRHWGLERILLEDKGGPLDALMTNALFDDLREWASSSVGGFSAKACPGLVVDCVRGVMGRCNRLEMVPLSLLSDGRLQEAGEGSSAGLARVLKNGADERCLRCWDELPMRIRETARWNRMEEEAGTVQYQLGLFALSRKDLDRARMHLEAVAGSASLAEGRGEALIYLGMLHLRRGDIHDAREALTRACSLLPGSASVIYHLGRCEFEERDYIAASDLFRKAMEMGIGPELEDDLRLYLGICHVRLEEFSEALDVLGSVERQSATLHFYRGVALSGLGRPEDALESLNRAMALGAEPVDLAAIHFYAGHCLKEMGRFLDALSPLNMALEADPRSYEAWNLLGYCLFRLKRHREAIGAFMKALELAPGSAVDHANVGSNLRDLGDLEQASRWYRRALKLDPTLVWARENLSKVEDELRRKRCEPPPLDFGPERS